MTLLSVLDPLFDQLLDTPVLYNDIMEDIEERYKASCALIKIKKNCKGNLFCLEMETEESCCIVDWLFGRYNELPLRHLLLGSLRSSIIFDEETHEDLIANMQLSILRQVATTFLNMNKKVYSQIVKSPTFPKMLELFPEEEVAASAFVQDYLAYRLKLNGWEQSELLMEAI